MAQREKVSFDNPEGEALAAVLEQPDTPARGAVLFAHCFTCGKDNSAASRIARQLTTEGLAVLRFDFTGLGGSDGDFANSNFSSNVEDLVAAAGFLDSLGLPPTVLVGHSLGGTAVLAAAHRLPSVKAVATIGAPASPEHVLRQFGDRVAEIDAQGEAEVELAGRTFRIRRDFVDDVRAQPLAARLAELDRALLILHAPFDGTVPIDQADQLLSRAQDARYAATVIAAWASRVLPEPAAVDRPVAAAGEVVVEEANPRFLRAVYSDDHDWLSDEPAAAGGDNLGPDPYEQLLAALGTCTSMTLRMYANRKRWPLTDLSVRLSHTREHAADCEGCEDAGHRVDVLRRAIDLQGELSDEQRQRLMEIADRCPVHRTLEGTLRIQTEEL